MWSETEDAHAPYSNGSRIVTRSISFRLWPPDYIPHDLSKLFEAERGDASLAKVEKRGCPRHWPSRGPGPKSPRESKLSGSATKRITVPRLEPDVQRCLPPIPTENSQAAFGHIRQFCLAPLRIVRVMLRAPPSLPFICAAGAQSRRRRPPLASHEQPVTKQQAARRDRAM